MSKDIRSYFQIKKQVAKVKEDEDIIPESPDVKIKNKKKESRKKRVICDDSDEETKPNKKVERHGKSHEKTGKSKNNLKEVNAVDMFGKAPLKRTEPLVKKVKKQTETGIHSDEEFEKSLLEMDNVEETHIKQIEEQIKMKPIDIKSDKNDHTLVEINKQSEGKHSSVPTDLNSSASKELTADDNKVVNSKVICSKRKFADFTESEIKCDNENKSIKRKKCESGVNSTTMIEIVDVKDDDDDNGDDKYSKSKKKNHDKSLNTSMLTDEERHERKIQSAALYKKYMNRSGPKHLGAKEIPEGLPDCLKNYAFLLTGVLESFEREEIIETINKYGGCIKNAISKKVTHVLAGEEGGPAKLAKAQDLEIPIISEDDFLDIIKNSLKHSTIKSENKTVKISNKSNKDSKVSKNNELLNKSHERKSMSKEKKIKSEEDLIKTKSPKRERHANKNSEDKIKINGDHNSDELKLLPSNSEQPSTSSLSKNGIKNEHRSQERIGDSSMWVEKYKPQNVKQIIGQHGDASNVKKLTNWLTKWYTNRKAKLPKPSPWAKNDDGGFYKAALLSGPPGVGKTTTVSLVCRELGFDMVEFNASDTRNKTLIKEQIGELLTTTSLSAYAKGDTSKQAVSKKHVLVMDEVDGMAGNEDRGGLQELINLVKITSVPIICMCNDRNSQKMRSLVNYCYDLRFNRPRVDQIKSAMMSICFKEGIKMSPDALTQLIVSANQDVRQTLNLLSMWAIDPNLNDSERLKRDANNFKKDVKLGPWEAIRKVFSAEDHKTMSVNNKSDLFFYDYSLAPLFVQENYLQVAPHCPKHEILQRVSKAADSISLGDIIEARIRRSQAWGLLPTQAMYSSVIPGHELSGHMTGQIQFPGWLGKNSRASKMHRLCQEIHAHTRLSTTGSKSSIFLDYSAHLRDAIVNPLIKNKSDGITESLEILESYHLLREDLDSLVELSLWPGQKNPTLLIDSKVKAAMTRTYNKTASALPYAPGSVKRSRVIADDYTEVDEDNVQEDSEDSDPEKDQLIKVQKKKSNETAKSNSSKGKASTSKTKTSKDKSKKK